MHSSELALYLEASFIEGAVNVLSMSFIKEADAKKYGALPFYVVDLTLP